jgi:hypothetical protein
MASRLTGVVPLLSSGHVDPCIKLVLLGTKLVFLGERIALKSRKLRKSTSGRRPHWQPWRPTRLKNPKNKNF